jgi:hypothetical protein
VNPKIRFQGLKAEPHLITSSFFLFFSLKFGYVHPTLQVGVSSKLTVSKVGNEKLWKKNFLVILTDILSGKKLIIVMLENRNITFWKVTSKAALSQRKWHLTRLWKWLLVESRGKQKKGPMLQVPSTIMVGVGRKKVCDTVRPSVHRWQLRNHQIETHWTNHRYGVPHLSWNMVTPCEAQSTMGPSPTCTYDSHIWWARSTPGSPPNCGH